jgi:SAM-dependent methyltransferase
VSAIERAQEVLTPGTVLREVERSVWSAFDTDPGAQQYDALAAGYDRLISNPLYQRLAWGNAIARDFQLSRDAVASASGWLLDAGCGSLLFTEQAHAEGGRASMLVDLSLGMLRRGRDRLVARCGRVPDHLVLVQGDVFALPFRPASFETVLCPGILHMFEARDALLQSLAGLRGDDGGFFASMLVTDRSFGGRLLRFGEKRGESPNPVTSARFGEAVAKAFGRAPQMDTRGNMAHARLERLV